MGKLKNAALVNAPFGVKTTAASPRKSVDRGPPTRFTYALAAYSVEIRDTGWHVAKSVPSFAGDKLDWSGPFATIETAVLAIGRRLATEIADRHTRMIEAHAIKPGDPRYGLKPTTRLRQNGKTKGSVA